jgi:hypothetical protein
MLVVCLRELSQIYTFADEDEMLTWLAVFNQAIAAVVMRESITHMQLHDYHGGLSLMYLPEAVRPAVLYVAHNAHYDVGLSYSTSGAIFSLGRSACFAQIWAC